MRGRKRKPAKLADLTGSRTKTACDRRKRRALQGDVAPAPVEAAPGLPLCPDWLGDEARRIWIRAMEVGSGWLSAAEEFKLAAFCQAMADLRHCSELVAREGLIVPAVAGGLTQHPAQIAKRGAMTIIAKLGSDLGFDPAARARIADKPDAAPSDADEFFTGPRLLTA